jgi:hypothetical protein
MPTLMPTRATLDGLIVSTEMEESPYLWAFTDDTVLGGPCNSKLVMSRWAVRVRSSALSFRNDRHVSDLDRFPRCWN